MPRKQVDQTSQSVDGDKNGLWQRFREYLTAEGTTRSIFFGPLFELCSLRFLMLYMLLSGIFMGLLEVFGVVNYWARMIPNDSSLSADGVKHVWRIGTTALLTGCVFQGAVRSMQAMGVFKNELKTLVKEDDFRDPLRDELAGIVYSEKFLGRWSDLRRMWKNTAGVLFNTLFDGIQDELAETFEAYMPFEEGSYYIKNYQLRIEKMEVDKDDPALMRTEETVEYEIVSKDDSVKPKCKFWIDTDGSEKIEVLSLRINDDEYLGRPEADMRSRDHPKKPGKKQHGYEFELGGVTSYSYKRQLKRTAPICSDDFGQTRSYRFDRCVSRMSVSVKSSDFSVYILRLGTKDELEDAPSGPSILL